MGRGTAVFLGFEGGVSTTIGTHIWTSTSVSDNQKWSVYMGPYDPWGIFCKHPVGGHECVSRISDRNYALCTRPLEADLLHIAKDAQVNHPVPDVQTLKNIVPLNKARLAFQAGQYQESVAQAQSALTLKADPATAYWGMGISYGMLGQWEQAISNLESALKIDKNYGDAKDSLKWARDCQKAAKNGKSAKDKPPVWE